MAEFTFLKTLTSLIIMLQSSSWSSLDHIMELTFTSLFKALQTKPLNFKTGWTFFKKWIMPCILCDTSCLAILRWNKFVYFSTGFLFSTFFKTFSKVCLRFFLMFIYITASKHVFSTFFYVCSISEQLWLD